MKNNMFKRLLLLALCLLLFACSNAAEPEAVESPAEESATVEEVAGETMEEESMASLSDMSWEEIVAQAQAEGEVAWFQWYLQPRFREFVVAFEEEYGIKVVIADGGLDANMNKFIAESGRETGDIDVLSTSFGEMSKVDLDGLFISLDQVQDIDKLTTVFEGVDTNGRGIAWWGNQTGIAYNPALISEDELPQTFEELTAWMEANPEQMGINDPNGGGAGASFIQAVVREFGGENDYTDAELDKSKTANWEDAWQWFESQTDNYVLTAGNADSLTRLNDGEFVLVPAWEDHLAGLQKEGAISADIAFYIPEFGMNGGANAITIPANAKNKAAALVLVNWIVSAETQGEFNKVFGSSPKHPDASDEFALVPNSQRAFSTSWFTPAYGDHAKQVFTDRIIMGNAAPAEDTEEAMEEEMADEIAMGPLGDMSWDEIVAQAQEEGEVAWFQWYLQPRFREFVVSFEEEFGIKVIIADGGLDANMNKFIAESGRESGDIDVLSTSFGEMSKVDLDELFMPLGQVQDIDKLTTVFEGVDTNGRGIAWWGNQTGIAYNPALISEDELPQTFEELTAWMEANPQQMGINDPNGGGAGASFIQAVVRAFGGDNDYSDAELDESKTANWEDAWLWFESQTDNYVLTAGNADSLTRLNDGEFILVPAWEDHLAGLQKEGAISADIAFYIPEFGMNGGANSITIPANAKNKAAALVLVNWIVSAETQGEFNRVFGSSPKHPEASDEFALVPNSQRAYSTGWFAPAYGDLAKQIFTDRIIMGQ